MGRLKIASLALGIAVLVLRADPAPMAVASNWSASLQLDNTAESGSGSAPDVPGDVMASCTSPTAATVDVTWDAVAGTSTYAVYESTTSSSAGYVLAQGDVSATSWTTDSLPMGTYWFEVAAYDGTNWASADSSATSARTITLSLGCS
ncbi:MAG TPA: hypothetical protein VMF35_13045 [Acidimicrobiales bacterium]|nr:hypothetical protein [Acidimicrobiales bacterium]